MSLERGSALLIHPDGAVSKAWTFSWVNVAAISWETFFTTGENTQNGDGTAGRDARVAGPRVAASPSGSSLC